MTEWIVSNEKRWRYMNKRRRADLATWLRMNGIDPGLVPTETPLTLSLFDDVWSIEFEQMVTDEQGVIVQSPDDPDKVEILHHSVELVIPPPSSWLTAVK